MEKFLQFMSDNGFDKIDEKTFFHVSTSTLFKPLEWRVNLYEVLEQVVGRDEEKVIFEIIEQYIKNNIIEGV